MTTGPVDTSVVIVGAGPSGLTLSHLLARSGIDSVVLESQSRQYVESRVRAGVLEHPTVLLLEELGLADRLHREGMVHFGIHLQFDGERHRIDLAGLTGKSIAVYGQQEVVKDLIAARVDQGAPLLFGAQVTAIEDIEGRPLVRYTHDGASVEVRADLVAGCDGFHGICRTAMPSTTTVSERVFPFAWLGILADVPPSTDELIYAFHSRGFAMHSMRSPSVSRLYLQVDPGDDPVHWPDERIWKELQIRLASPGWTLTEGPVLEKSITPMRSAMTEPMSSGHLYLAGDSAHIVPPTGAKGLNLAVADAALLAEAIALRVTTGSGDALETYSDRCLTRVWRAQEFSTSMTSLLHVDPVADHFSSGLQRARRHQLVMSMAVRAALAENYVGLPLDRAS